MLLTYIYHDCFMLQSASCTVVFDYFADPAGSGRFLDAVDPEKPLYVLVSHHHKDHFTPAIFTWAHRFPRIHYILSKDTARAVNYILKPGSTYRGPYVVDRSWVTVLRPGQVYTDGTITVNAYGSTDIGNSYLLAVDGRTVLHAGDLNAWVWKDESTPAEVAAAVRDFEAIVDTIAPGRIDLALFPVDARLGRDYWEGAYRFTRLKDVGLFVPMHFCLGADPAENARFATAAVSFSRYANPERGRYAAMTLPYERLTL